MLVIDTHAHLDEESFDVDRPDVIARAVQAGVHRVLTIGTTAATSQRAVELAALWPMLSAAVGIQPNYVSQAKPGDWETIEQLSTHPEVRAIGETGLDRYWDYAPFDIQIDYFQRHIDLARRRQFPFVVHCRQAEADTVAQLQQAAKAGPLSGVMHSFTGDLATANACLDLGLYISFAGMVTFKKSAELRAVARAIPADRLLVETDAPYLAPQPVRGKRNEPAFVVHTLTLLAEMRGVPAAELARQTTENACRLFGWAVPPADAGPAAPGAVTASEEVEEPGD
jgi:TatD DNase family protein